MAFVSMFLVFLAGIVLLLVASFVIGLALMVCGLIVRALTKKDNSKKSKVVPALMIVPGIILMVPPVLAALLAGGSFMVYLFKQYRYDNPKEKWQHEYVDGSTAIRAAIGDLLTNADAGDHRKFARIFADSIMDEPDFDENVDLFLESFPDGLSEGEIRYFYTVSSDSINSEEQWNISHFAAVDVTYGEETYHVFIAVNTDNSGDPGDVGVVRFLLMDDASWADYLVDSNTTDEYRDTYLYLGYGDSDTRTIGSRVLFWEESDGPVPTFEEMTELVNSDMTIQEMMDRGFLGTPNAQFDPDNSPYYDYYYEITGNDDYSVVQISTESPYGKIVSAYPVSGNTIHYSAPMMH